MVAPDGSVCGAAGAGAGPGWPEPRALIVKLFPDAGEAWARESAALIAAPASAPVPDLIAAGADPPLVVMTDAG